MRSTELGYRAPLPDRGTPTHAARARTPGSTSTSATSARTATTATPPPTGRTRAPRSAYLVLDDDFTDFAGSATPGQLMRVTAAHEFFHIVQFAYDQYEDGWFMESTATWMEERVYDAVNDNRQYLPASALAMPGRSLDYPLHRVRRRTATGSSSSSSAAASAVRVVKSMWSRAAADGVYSTVAISRTLKAEGTSLRARFAGFAANNLYPARTLRRGRALPPPAGRRDVHPVLEQAGHRQQDDAARPPGRPQLRVHRRLEPDRFAQGAAQGQRPVRHLRSGGHRRAAPTGP